MAADTAFRFGPFCFLPSRRMLLDSGAPVRLGSRAFDLLVVLIERAGEVVSNAELVARVWPNVVVESGALRVHLAGLRKVLGDGREGHRYIINIPLKGYSFVAPVSCTSGAVPDPQPSSEEPITAATGATPVSAVASDAPVSLPLPAQVARLIGRDEVVAELLRDLPQRRCITVVGPAGIGKTTVALAAARLLAPSFERQAVFVNLAPLNDPGLVTAAVISALGVPALAADPMRGLLAYLRGRRLLLLLDNCEHLIEASAVLAETLLTGAPDVHLLITSREPLRIQGEWVQRLGSLQVPPTRPQLTVQEMLRYSSVELFVERVRAGLDSFDLTEANLGSAGAICRALDGIPLALELAAAGVERLGVHGVVAHLGDRLVLLTRGRRTALPRHQTLCAALDWGYALLTPSEQSLLQALSIFRSRFTAEAASAVSGRACSLKADEDLYNLVSKSLVASDISGEVVRYSLLETMREYARMHLQANGDTQEVAARHASHMLEVADAAERLRSHQSLGDWLAHHAHLIDDIRAALQWSLSPAGDIQLGAALVGASAPLWFALSRIAEYLDLVEQFLSALGPQAELPPAREIALREAHGHALWHIRGTGPEAIATFHRAMEVADKVSSPPDRMRVMWGLWLVSNSSGDYRLTAQLAQKFGELAAVSKHPGSEIVHHRMMTMSMHFTGRHAIARQHAQRVLDQPLTTNLSARNSGFHFDQRATALTALARILWVLGFPQQALDHAECAVQRALAINHSLSLCFALSIGCNPVAFWAGDWDRGIRYTRLLQERSREYSLSFWQKFANGYELVVRRRDGDTDTLESLANLPQSLRDTLCTLDPELADGAAFDRGLSGGVPWSAPELLRIEGERLKKAGRAKEAEAKFRAGAAMAHDQEALSWELRCAMSLAVLLQDTKSAKSARAALRSVHERFTEGFETADLRSAAELLERLN